MSGRRALGRSDLLVGWDDLDVVLDGLGIRDFRYWFDGRLAPHDDYGRRSSAWSRPGRWTRVPDSLWRRSRAERV